MARENQGLQIALIIFVMLTIILGVTTFIFFRQYEEATIAAKEAEESATEQRSANAKLVEDANRLKEMMGFDKSLSVDEATEKKDEDMRKYAGNFNANNQFYSPVLEYLYTTLQQKNEELADARDAAQAVQTQLAVREGQKDGQIQQLSQAVAQAGQDKQTVIAKATSERDRVLQDRAKLQQQWDQARKQSAETVTKLQGKLQETSVQMTKLAQLNQAKSRKLDEMTRETFEVPDGEVRWVDQGRGIVWINLGREDALARQTTFSVYPASTSNLVQAGKKASIEVVRIRGDHLAEARVLEDAVADPIMPGDKIHTPVWSPGEQKRFALAGFMDVDNDGRSDLATVRNLISMNGGVVDAWIDDDAKQHGQITVNTRYLVLGQAPNEKGQPEMIKVYTRMREQAERHGVQKIPLADLLQRMGWRKKTEVVQFGRGANPNDFRAKPDEGVTRTSTGNVSEIFRPRRPPGDRGAY